MTDTTATYTFQAEVQQLLHILSHALYTNREIFLRELISNSSDALTRMRVELLTTSDVVDHDAELAIRISSDEQAGTITIADTGIGMTAEEIVENLGTIAHSGARAVLERLEREQRSDLIGQFGVGFYSVFAVAERVVVTSRSFRPGTQAVRWESEGGSNYTVMPDDRVHRGTTVTLHLKQDAADYARPWQIEQIVKTHSDFVAFPIYVGDRQVNQTKPLWRRSPRAVEATAYTEAYRQLTFDWDEPLLHVHVSTDAPIDLHAILFVPAKRERGMLERRVDGRIKLYSRSVLIQDNAHDLLLPSYFRFIEGVVDSEDVPLNVSREGVQRTSAIDRIKTTLTKRLVRELTTLAEQQPEQYRTFWNEFGPFLKEGIALDAGAQTDLLKLLRFHSSHGDALVDLSAYRERMVDGQKAIYYVLAPDLESARHSPHLDAFTARNIETLLLVDLVDPFLMTSLREFEGLPFQNADDPNLDLPPLADDDGTDASESEAFDQLIIHMKEVLGERVVDVRSSKVLTTNPVRLVAAEDGAARSVQRVQRLLNRDAQLPPSVLEVNRSHPVIRQLAHRQAHQPNDPVVMLVIEQLYDTALLLDGLHPNPTQMVPRIQQLLDAALRGSTTPS